MRLVGLLCHLVRYAQGGGPTLLRLWPPKPRTAPVILSEAKGDNGLISNGPVVPAASQA